LIKRVVGRKLKSTRLENDSTIQELAQKSGVSSNMISRIERGLTIPSVEILMKLAGAFRKSINYFVEEAEKGMTAVHTPLGQGEPIFFFEDKHQILSLTHGIRDPGFAVFYDTLEEGCSSGDGGMVHSGDEFVRVLQGKVEFTIDGQQYLLSDGDSIAFKASYPHSWKNMNGGQTHILWVLSPAPNLGQ